MTTPFKAARPAAGPIHPPAAARALSTHPFPAPRLSERPLRSKPLMRKYEVASLARDGGIRISQHIAPATPPFEGAFSAFARSTMIQTVNGPCAIEDLAPGERLDIVGGKPLPVVWIGSMTLVPTAPVERPEFARLTRIMADTFGLARPMPDLVLGPGARLLRCPAELRELAMQTGLLTPARAFVDGTSIIEITPPAPVTLYHLCLPRHAVIRAGGLEVESYHPGKRLLRDMGTNMRTLFLSLFPHITEDEGFGPMAHPHAGQATLEALMSA